MNAPSEAFLHDKLQALQAQADEFIAVRRDIHKHPEMGYKEYRTSDLVAEQLEKWGYAVTRGLGGTGVVGQLKRGTGGKAIGLRADMDALPIDEATGLPYASCNTGIMHACGHDGHTAMLLAAAKHIAQKATFSGTVNLIFQPAEEGLGGAKKMMDDGLFRQFPCDAIFGMHNMPGHPQGHLVMRDGAAMASSDNVTITVEGTGGHGAVPHRSADPVVAASAIVMGLQSIVARNVDPQEMAVITVGAFNAGIANNVIPQLATLRLSVRALNREVRELLEKRITELTHAQAQSYGVRASIDYKRGYPVLVNHMAETDFVQQVAEELVGKERVVRNPRALTGSEDFAFMLEEVPGPDNRLDQQPAMTGNLGGDYRLRSLPLTLGGNFNWNPAYDTRRTEQQWAYQGAKRVVDVYGLWKLSSSTGLRLTVSNLTPLDYITGSTFRNGIHFL